MKKKFLLLLITLAMLLTSLTSCQYTRWNKVVFNSRKDLVKAFNSEERDELAKLFAPSVASAPDFEYNATMLLSLLPPKVVDLEDGLNNVSAYISPLEEAGKTIEYAKTSFKVSANGKHYDIAFIVCYKNPIDADEIGILSLYITDYYAVQGGYSGGGWVEWDWPRGINFDLQ